MQSTGNPFVDTGLTVLATLAGKETVADLSFADLRRVFGSGEQLARDNQARKCISMVFLNGPLTQPAYTKSKKSQRIYIFIVRQLLDVAESEGKTGERCDLTGIPTTLNFQSVCATALRAAGCSVPEKKWLGRDWVPLGGSLSNDAQALPVASRPLHVSALALFALQYLPLGVFLFKGRLACLQTTQPELAFASIAEVVKENKSRLALGNYDTQGKGGGTGTALDLLLRCFDDVSFHPGNEALLWLFSNGKTSDCQTEPIPDKTLAFIAHARDEFGSEIRSFIRSEPKDSRLQLFECIRAERDYPSLYPFKKTPGASPEFYGFYQREVLGATDAALTTARKVAGILRRANADKKQAMEMAKPEFLKSASGRSMVRKTIVENLLPHEYGAMFPSKHHPVRVEGSGWNYLRFYLATQKSDSREIPLTQPLMQTTHPKIIQIAETYRGVEPRKIRNLLDQMAQRKIGVRWLQDKFCRLAKEHPSWELGDWDEFVCDEDGKVSTFELLFQIRLYLSNLYREVKGDAA